MRQALFEALLEITVLVIAVLAAALILRVVLAFYGVWPFPPGPL